MNWTDGDIQAELTRSKRAKPFGTTNWWEIRTSDGFLVYVIAEIGPDGTMPFPGMSPQYIKDRLRITPKLLLRLLNGEPYMNKGKSLLRR